MNRSRIVSGSIIVSRAVYSMYWVYLSPAYIYILKAFSIQKYYLGYISWSFIAGAASTQIPAAYIAAKIGPEKTYISGLMLLSAAGIASVMSPTFQLLLVTRAVAGAGAGLFFSTAGYVISYLNQRRVGLWMGIYNAAFAIGAIAAYGLGMLYTESLWKPLVVLLSLLGIATSGVDFLIIRKSGIKIEIDKRRPSFKRNIKPILAAVALSGYWGSFYASETLLPSYFAYARGSLYLGNAVTILLLVFSFIGGFGTYFYDLAKRKRLFVFLVVLLGSSGYIFFVSRSLALIVAGIFLIGFFNELSLSSLYAIAVQLSEEKWSAMSLSLVNFVNMVLGMWVSILFSYLMVLSSTMLWISMFLVTVIPAVPLLNGYFEPKLS
ncbi:MAG: MFS transporter [Nitrososphaeria archaeon]